MVGHEVNHHFHAGMVDAAYAGLELVETVRHILCKVRVYVVVISYGIRTSGMALDYMWIVAGDAVACVVGVVRVLYHSCQPYVIAAQAFNVAYGF